MGVDFSNFQQTLMWVIAHGYLIIFLVMCVEGPVTTAAAGFAAALGYFNPWIILSISILGDLIPDSFYYAVGYFGRGPVVEKAARYFGLNQARADRIELKLREHFGKTMVALKLTPVVPTFGFMLVGYLRLSFIKFTKYSSAVTVPKSITFLVLGYFFGRLYDINQYLHYAEIFFPIMVIVILGGIIIYNKISARIANKLEKL
jgi:membrane protein DedA with SNARE-associated domain